MVLNTCANCKTDFNNENLICENCGKITFPKIGDFFSVFDILIMIIGYYLMFFMSGFITGIISKSIIQSDIFSPLDLGMIAMGIAFSRYFSQNKSLQSIWVCLGALIASIISASLYVFFIKYFYVNFLISLILGLSFGSFIGLVINKGKSSVSKFVWFFGASIFAGIFACSIIGLIIDLKIIGFFSLEGLVQNIIYGAISGAVFAILFKIIDNAVHSKNAILNLFYATLGAFICGGLLGASIDAYNFNPFWSGLFETQDSVFYNIKIGFIRDGVICGSIAFGITFMNSLVNEKANRFFKYIFTALGGAIGGGLAIYILLNLPVNSFTFSTLEKTFYEIVNIKQFSLLSLFLLGIIFGGPMSLGVIVIKDFFNKTANSFTKKILNNSLGGFLGGFLGGISCSIVIILNSKLDLNFKLIGALIFLVSVIGGIYGLLISLGMSLSKYNAVQISSAEAKQ